MSTQALLSGIITALIAGAILGMTMDNRTVGIIMGIAIGMIAAMAPNGEFTRGPRDR